MRIIFDLINHIVYLFSGIDKIELSISKCLFYTINRSLNQLIQL